MCTSLLVHTFTSKTFTKDRFPAIPLLSSPRLSRSSWLFKKPPVVGRRDPTQNRAFCAKRSVPKTGRCLQNSNHCRAAAVLDAAARSQGRPNSFSGSTISAAAVRILVSCLPPASLSRLLRPGPGLLEPVEGQGCRGLHSQPISAENTSLAK